MFGLESVAAITKYVTTFFSIQTLAHMASDNFFHFNAFTLTIIAVIVVAVAAIILRLIPKKQPVTQIPPATTPLTNIPIEYADYLKHQKLDELYNGDETFTMSKFFTGFGQGRNWAKAIVLGTMVAVMLAIGYCIVKKVEDMFFTKPVPIVSTITNSGTGSVEAKTESKSEAKSSNGLNLNFLSNWF